MERKITRNVQKGRQRYDMLKAKEINRFQQNAARLEHCNVRNKNKGKKG